MYAFTVLFLFLIYFYCHDFVFDVDNVQSSHKVVNLMGCSVIQELLLFSPFLWPQWVKLKGAMTSANTCLDQRHCLACVIN